MQEKHGFPDGYATASEAHRPLSTNRAGPVVLLSACLAGLPTRYDGSHRRAGELLGALDGAGIRWVPVCPEQLGGLPTPRPACWLAGGGGPEVLEGRARVVDEHGVDRTGAFVAGARAVLGLARRLRARWAVLQDGSPSCGVHRTHRDATKVPGRGVTATCLAHEGIEVLAPSEALARIRASENEVGSPAGRNPQKEGTMVKVTYQGHACFHLDDGAHRVLIDPFLTGNPHAQAGPESFEDLDAILVTHGHGDHLGDAVEISKRTGAIIVAPFELAAFCQRRGANVHPMHIGGSRRFEFGRVKLTIAHHGSAFVDKGTEYTGNPCGFLLELGGLLFYHAGDTALFYDMKLIGEMNRIDVAFLPIGDNFTMGPEDAAKAVEFLRPRWVVPMHYGTFDVLEQSPEGFVKALEGTDVEVVVIPFGGTREFR